jgi:4-carboxymuconolactone decarboxylase
MARIPYFIPKDTDTEKLTLLKNAPPLNLIKMLAHTTYPITRRFLGLSASILGEGKLDPILREMAIIRTGIVCKSKYEVYQHRWMSRGLGLPEEKFESLLIGSEAPTFSEIEHLVLEFTEELVLQHKASDGTFAALSKHLSHGELVELTIAVGCYIMVSTFLNNFEVDIEDKRST